MSSSPRVGFGVYAASSTKNNKGLQESEEKDKGFRVCGCRLRGKTSKKSNNDNKKQNKVRKLKTDLHRESVSVFLWFYHRG